MQFHPLPLMVTGVNPAGMVSATVTVDPSVGADPALLTVRKNASPIWFCAKFPPLVMPMARSTALVTVRPAEAVLPVPPLVDVTAPVTLVYTPADAPVTVTGKIHCAFAAMIAFASAIVTGAVAVKVPPHTGLVALTTVSPVGSVSVNPTPVKVTALVPGFVMVKVSVEVAPAAIEVGLNAFAMDGCAITVIDAFAFTPAPPLVEVMGTVLFFTPAVEPVTLTETVQLAPGASVAVAKLTTDPPGVAEGVPLQVLFRLGVAATTKPAGKVSVKVTPVSVRLLLELLSVKVNEVLVPSGIVSAPNAFAITGGAITVRFAEARVLLPAAVEFRVTLLVRTPSVPGAVTSTLMVQGPTGQVAFAKVTVPDPAVAVTDPPQLLTTFGVEATVKPGGKVSEKLASIAMLFGLFSENVMVLFWPGGTEAGLNALEMVGG